MGIKIGFRMYCYSGNSSFERFFNEISILHFKIVICEKILLIDLIDRS